MKTNIKSESIKKTLKTRVIIIRIIQRAIRVLSTMQTPNELTLYLWPIKLNCFFCCYSLDIETSSTRGVGYSITFFFLCVWPKQAFANVSPRYLKKKKMVMNFNFFFFNHFSPIKYSYLERIVSFVLSPRHSLLCRRCEENVVFSLVKYFGSQPPPSQTLIIIIVRDWIENHLFCLFFSQVSFVFLFISCLPTATQILANLDDSVLALSFQFGGVFLFRWIHDKSSLVDDDREII